MLQAKGSKASLHVGEDAWQTQTIDTAQSLAEFLQVAKSSVRKWTRTTDIPRLYIGRAVRYPRAAVLCWLQDRQGS